MLRFVVLLCCLLLFRFVVCAVLCYFIVLCSVSFRCASVVDLLLYSECSVVSFRCCCIVFCCITLSSVVLIDIFTSAVTICHTTTSSLHFISF